MAAATGSATFQEVTNSTGRVFRVGETPNDILGWGTRRWGRWVPIMAAWLAMCLAGLLEYTWGALNPSLSAAHGWGPARRFFSGSVSTGLVHSAPCPVLVVRPRTQVAEYAAAA